MKLTRTLARVFCVSLLFLGSASRAQAAFWDLFFNNTSVEENVDDTIDAVTQSETEGIPSHESFVDNNLLNVQTSSLIFVAGPPESATGEESTLTEEQKRIVYKRYGGGAIGAVGNGIAALYTPPASSTTYVADLLRSAHIVPQAQAQGLGFASLDPILGTWKIFRNVAYLFFVVIFLIIGFMIMFRQKINGQTVVTAQQAIPGIIVSLIFVTFSYAIAGFMIDLMYLLMYLMIVLFNPPEGTAILDNNIFDAIWYILIGKGEGVSLFSSVSGAVENFTKAFTGNLGAASGALGWLAGITAALVVAVAILIAAFKILFELLKTYVSIVLSIALAPITLMFGAIPGQNSFFKWLKRLVGNLLAFPVVLMTFIPPFLPGRGVSGAIVTLVGIGILLIIPEIIQQVKKAFGAEGGIVETLGGQMIQRTREAGRDTLQYGWPTARVTGGLGLDAYRAYQQRSSRGPKAVLSGFWDLARVNTPIRAGEAYDQTQGLLNIKQSLKPSNFEHLLDSERRERRKEKRGKIVKNLSDITN